MIWIGFLVGGLLGGFQAYRRKGNRMDIAQYAVVYGIVCALLVTFASIIYQRMS